MRLLQPDVIGAMAPELAQAIVAALRGRR